MKPRVVLRPDVDDVDPYRLLTALVVPRPIAWIATVSDDGVGNLAPHSFFTVARPDPPVVAFTSVGVKDTLTNIRATGEFTISLVSLPSLDRANATSAALAPEVDEADACEIAMRPSSIVRPPQVAESPAAMECRLHGVTEFGTSTMVFGEVVAFSIDEAVLNDGHPDFTRLAPLSRLGRNEWGLPPGVVSRSRPR